MRVRDLPALPLRALIHAYQWGIAPVMAPRCRFLPSCSEYALEAIAQHGAFRGAWLTVRRLVRCHPWGGHGYDPVPETCCGHHAKPESVR